MLGKSTWAVLALTCMIEFFTQTHYRESIAWDGNLSALYKDIFLFHWKEESYMAVELLLPGGTLIALLMWLASRRKAAMAV